MSAIDYWRDDGHGTREHPALAARWMEDGGVVHVFDDVSGQWVSDDQPSPTIERAHSRAESLRARYPRTVRP